MGVLDRVLESIVRYRAYSKVGSWRTSLTRHPKWHKKDLLLIETPGQRGEACQAHMAIRKDGTGLVFSHDSVYSEHTVVMDGWDHRAAASALLACVAWHAVPPKHHRAMVRVRECGDAAHSAGLKELQEKIRKSRDEDWADGRRWPPCVLAGIDLLKARHAELSGADVREKIQTLEYPFRFLQSKGVPFERIRQAWDEALVQNIMES